jgi:DNA-binding response OmpR family regulator
MGTILPALQVTQGALRVRVLIVEDEPATRDLLERGLREELFRVEAVGDATSAEALAATSRFDAIVLDVMLPDHDGFAVCQRLRTRGVDTPILLLAGRHGVTDRVHGLDAGADDYLGKPFAFEELLARLRAVTRRGRTRHRGAVLACGPVALDPRSRLVTVGTATVLLTDTEFRLLHYLLVHADELVTRADLEQAVWPGAAASNVIDVYVGYLRRKLGSARRIVRTVRGVGYTVTEGRRVP